MLDLSASLVTGGGMPRTRVENARTFYNSGCAGYFEDMLSKRNDSFFDSACGFLLLDSLLQKNRISRAELIITLDGQGRPRTNLSGLDFSISHSEGCAVCVVEIGEGANVGVDVQRERPYSPKRQMSLRGRL